MELEDDQRAAMREYKRQEHQAHMDILHRTLELKTAYLRQFVDSKRVSQGSKKRLKVSGVKFLADLPVILLFLLSNLLLLMRILYYPLLTLNAHN